MGMCLDGNDKFEVEVRRESFILHFDNEATHVFPGDIEHPEFLLEDLDDLIAALEEAREYIKKKRRFEG